MTTTKGNTPTPATNVALSTTHCHGADTAQLHAGAENALSRALFELRSETTDWKLAQTHADAAAAMIYVLALAA